MGKADIQRVMQMLDPDECAARYELPNIMARESFRLDVEVVESFDQMIEICARYYTHHFNAVIVENGARDLDFLKGEVWHLLDRHYQNGAQAAYKAARTGMNGGLPGVLDTIRDWFLKDMEDKYFNYTLMESVDVMDLQDIRELMRQYHERYARHIDGGNMPDPDYMVMNWRDIIKAHAQWIKAVRTQYGR